ncbi:MAG: 23S rRNA (pseudouridine(1915)-N(3))-methyltransferase RlmH [Gemmatimonadetes bacterium]|nr:23S rRNA (pseudouridine(1915)-N(3))-methyltransferase RlmH [Gemmatimonadota bacterium]HRX19722.1 23S rRNA (pseudouridine(1915)-N(3))-methyltransferase RlmH [Gemmatimonadales bacterium]
MQVLLVAVGKLRPALREVCDDYLRRTNRLLSVAEHEVREAGRLAGRARLEEEDRRLLARIPDGTPATLLDVGGATWSSEELAGQVDDWRHAGRDHALIIGGAAGVGSAVRERVTARWSLGRITLPHELARVVVAEQLYRAMSILQGTPYHRGAT